MTSPRTFGRNLSQVQDRLYDRLTAIDSAENRLFANDLSSLRRRERHRTRILSLAAALAVFLTGAVLWAVLKEPMPLSVDINGRMVDVTASFWIPMEKTPKTDLGFSDGSTVQLTRHTRARFMGLDALGAQLLIEQGALHAAIAKRQRADWRFLAGPFEVKVIGTEFDLLWNPATGRLSIDMMEGTVQVEGPSIKGTQRVAAGESFQAWAAGEKASRIFETSKDEPEKRPLKKRAEEILSSNEALVGDELPLTPFAKGGIGTQTQLTLSENKQVESAEQNRLVEGASKSAGDSVTHSNLRETPLLASTCPQNTSKRLGQADELRRSGDFSAANAVYKRLRICRPSSKIAALSAFYLGKISFDHDQDWQAAAIWFERYMAEAKGVGPMREAMGRLMEAYVHAHQKANAKKIASKYLAKYPNGPHAAYAESLMEEDTDSPFGL